MGVCIIHPATTVHPLKGYYNTLVTCPVYTYRSQRGVHNVQDEGNQVRDSKGHVQRTGLTSILAPIGAAVHEGLHNASLLTLQMSHLTGGAREHKLRPGVGVGSEMDLGERRGDVPPHVKLLPGGDAVLHLTNFGQVLTQSCRSAPDTPRTRCTIRYGQQA